MAFVLSSELLTIQIRDCKDIKGITHLDVVNSTDWEQELKIALYADDITLFCGNEHKMPRALSIVDSFSCLSGIEVNKQKSEAMWLGCKKYCTDAFGNFVWKKKLKVLGVYICNDMCASNMQDN